MPDETRTRLKETFARIEREHRERGERVIWRLLDGFLLYWDKVRMPEIFHPILHLKHFHDRTSLIPSTFEYSFAFLRRF